MISRRGYILLTVLLLILLASVLMATVCRLAVGRSLDAAAAEADLQRRWGTVSCRESVLNGAENILGKYETPSRPVTRVHADFLLGQTSFSIDVCDEQSKTNLNALYARLGKDRTESAVKTLAAATPRLKAPSPRRMPTKKRDADEDPADAEHFAVAFGSWAEVFPAVEPAALFPGSTPTAHLTLWGNGSLNLRRASLESLTQVCQPDLSVAQVNRLYAIRGRLSDEATVDQALAAVHAGTAETLTAAGRLTTVSAAHSLWIVSKDATAVRRMLFVRDSTRSDDVRSFSLQW